MSAATSTWASASGRSSRRSTGRVLVVDEIALRDTNTLEMGRLVLSKYGSHTEGIAVYGDSAGMNRSTAGKSDYAILYELGFRTRG